MGGRSVHYRVPCGAARTPLMKLTGERPIEGKTPPSLLALHDAGYREVRQRLGRGTVLDLGCGLGDATVGLDAPERTVIGLDYDAATAIAANRRHGIATVGADGASLPLRERSVHAVCSSHLIEHFTQPATHVAEVSRVLHRDGTAFFITPNAPADFENPYHVSLFEPQDLARLLARYFDEVEVLGLDGDPVVKSDFERRRVLARRLLKLDPLGLRHRLPRQWYVGLHAAARRVLYPVLALRKGSGPTITADRFSIGATIDESTLVLFAVARRPRVRPSGRHPRDAGS